MEVKIDLRNRYFWKYLQGFKSSCKTLFKRMVVVSTEEPKTPLKGNYTTGVFFNFLGVFCISLEYVFQRGLL